MAKFTAHDAAADAHSWGSPYSGSLATALTREEELYRKQVDQRSMSTGRAQRVFDMMDTSKPWFSRVEFVEAIAALCALYPQEVAKRVMSANKPVYRILWSCYCRQVNTANSF